MRALVVYNTRGMVAPLEILRSRHLEHCDLFIHCGNSMVDYQNEFIEGYVVIQGSDDFETHFLRDYVFEVDSQRMLIINNIDYRGESGLDNLEKFVHSLYDKMTIVVCAYTSVATSTRIDNTLYVAPGDASNDKNSTYSIIETEDEGIRINTFDIISGELQSTVFYEQIHLPRIQ